MPPRARRLVGLSAAEVAALKLTLNDPAKRLKGDSRDASFINGMKHAELIRRNPASTEQQLQKQRDIPTRINQRDGL